MRKHHKFTLGIALVAVVALAGCQMGPSVSGNFDRSYDVSGPVRLELSNVAGDISITGTSDKKVHIHGDVRVSGFGFGDSQKRLNEILASPPVELKGDLLEVGRDLPRVHNASISYTVEIPVDSVVNSASVSGSITVRHVKGPVQAHSVSGSIDGEDIGQEARLASTSGSINAAKCGDNVRATSVSGSVAVTDTKGDVIAHSVSGTVRVEQPGGRVDGSSSSGTVEIRGGNGDVKARSSSGHISVQGNPSGNSFWELKTSSGSVDIAVPSTSNFHFSANAVSGQISTQIPIVIEEQGKHSLRAHMGDGGGRVEIHTVSGGIEVQQGT